MAGPPFPQISSLPRAGGNARRPHAAARAGAAAALRMLLLLGAGAGALALPGQPVHAQPAEDARRDFAIPAGPLGQALGAFSSAAGIELSVDADLLRGKDSAGLSGSYTVRQGFAELLRGQGLQAVRRPNGSYTLAPAADRAAGVAVLADVTVEGAAPAATTEGTGSYTTRSMSTATKMSLSPRETPQSVSVLARQQMDDLGMTTLDDAVRNITGLTVQKGYYSGDSGSFIARGFEVSNLLLDGLPVSTGANGTFNADNDALDIYDRVEVVRGAAGLTTGAGTPSAAINLVRKRPTAQPQASLTLSAGSWDNYRAVLDAGGPVNAAGTLRGRAVVTTQDTRQFYHTADDHNHQFYGIVEADLTPATVATLGLHYRKVDNDGFLQGLPTREDGSFLPDLKRSTNLTNDFDYWRQTDRTVFAELFHELGNGWQAKAAAVWKRPEQDMVFAGMSRIDGILYQNTQRYRLDNRQDSYDVFLNGPVSMLGRTHEVMLGASYRRFDNRNRGGWADYSWTDAGPMVDPYRWDDSSVARPAIDMTLWRYAFTRRQKGIYAAARLNPADPLKIILGTRMDWFESENHGSGTRFKVARELTPYAGAIYDLDGNHSAYASWTSIFDPQEARDQDGELLDPITGTNYEVGVKGEYFGGRLNASLAGFLIKQRNRAVDDLNGPNPCPGSAWGYCQRASGEVESRGVELEIGGSLTPAWQMMAGYTYVTAQYTKDSDPANVGRTFNNTLPRHQFKLSTSYRLPGGLYRWRVGGTLYAQSRIRANDSSGIVQSGYAVVGLHAAYSPNDDVELRLNLNNLFDRRYYQTVGWSDGGNVFGAPRNFLLTMRYRL